MTNAVSRRSEKGEGRSEGGDRRGFRILLLSPLLLAALFLAPGCMKKEIAGDKTLVEKVGFFWYNRKGYAVAKLRKPQGVVWATVRVRMWEGDELILDPPPRTVPVLEKADIEDRSSEWLIQEPIPDGVDRVEVELVEVKFKDDLPPE